MQKITKYLVKKINNLSKLTKLIVSIISGLFSVLGNIYFFTKISFGLDISKEVYVENKIFLLFAISVVLMFIFVAFLISYFRDLKVMNGYVDTWLIISFSFALVIFILFLPISSSSLTSITKAIPIIGIELFVFMSLIFEFPKNR